MIHVSSQGKKDWVREAVARIEADFQRSADTHLLALAPHGFPGVDLYLKDESSHPTGSLKHRLARSLFLYALCNNWLGPRSTVVEASSGSTAVSEAYFARLIGLPFVAVMPATVSTEKIRAIERQGGRCELVSDPMAIYAASERLAKELGGHYMDQFTYAERATDWRSNNNIAESIFTQMRLEPHPVPRWIVCAAGTGGTLATVGRYVRYAGHETRVCGVDAEHSVFFDHYLTGDCSLRLDRGSRIEGIGRPRVEASFLSSVLDAMVKIPDVWSVAAMLALSKRLGRLVGPSTGTNLLASVACAAHMQERGERGSIVTLLCDSGERYTDSYYRADWRAAHRLECERETERVEALLERGEWCPALLSQWRVGGELEGKAH